MSRWRIILVVFLITIPLLVLAVTGSYYLWTKGLSFHVWWPLAGCMILGYLLAWYWQQKRMLLRPVDFTAPRHWTERDQEAWKLVKTRAEQASKMNMDDFVEFQFYVDTAQEMAEELSRFYHPKAKDPIGSLTIPEILAVIELASHDLSELVDQYLPGGHLLTVNDWRRADRAIDWYRKASNVYWAVAAVFNPLQTGARYLASQVGLSQPWAMLQQSLVDWFFVAYLNQST